MSLDLIVSAVILSAVSGLPGLLFPRSSAGGRWLAVGLMSAAAVMGLAGAGLGLYTNEISAKYFLWPAAGNSLIGIDALSMFFLIPVFLIGGLGPVYGVKYWPQRRYRRSGRMLQVFWGLLVSGMSILVISKHAMAFLFGWEIMALSAFFLISIENHRPETRKAGLVYLIATHVSTLTLFGMFSYWHYATGSYALEPVIEDTLSLGAMNGIFFLSLFGFGIKAGVMPLHFWLPDAHANAPSHVSAMLSGVLLKMGIYGLLRILFLLPGPPSAWGGLLIILGAAGGLLGVVFAIGQHDLKRLLAYHSVENIGIILIGMGLAMLGRSAGRPEWFVLGMAGCLLHVWNHCLFKSLLFLGAGSVMHAAGTRLIDRLGGLAKSMPWTSALFLTGAVSICGLPPMNGFISEFFVYLGLFGTVASEGSGTGWSAAVIAAPVLAMIGALAVACFVKVFGAVFLGNARTSDTANARESSLLMLGPMAVLAALCALIGLVPSVIGPVIDRVVSSLGSGHYFVPVSIAVLAPLKTLGRMSLSLLVFTGVIWILTALIIRMVRHSVTWDCGYAAPTSRMQYTASSFAGMIVDIFSWITRPRVHGPRIDGQFPGDSSMNTHVDDAVLDRIILPGFHSIQRRFGWFRRFQQGLIQNYILYILIIVILMLATLIPFRELFGLLIGF